MGIYFEEDRKKARWDSGQAILHKESMENQKERTPQRDNEAYRITNSYGTLRYLKKDKKKDDNREGFAVEAFEAPGTPVHTEKEKHLDRQNMKKVKINNKQTLFSSEVPLRNQALFFNMTGSKKSAGLLKYMKTLIHKQGHQTLKDTFGFLDQEPERMELETLKSERQDTDQKRIDTLNNRLRRKEAKERQLLSELQLMLDQRMREEIQDAHENSSQKEEESPQKDKSRNDDSPQRRLFSDSEIPETVSEGESDEEPEDIV